MKKIGVYTISDQLPKFGDTIICVEKNNFNYGKTMEVNETASALGIIDTKNWKVVVGTDSSNAVDKWGLIAFKNEHEVTFARVFGNGKNKKLTITLNGSFKVYSQNKVVLETKDIQEATDKFNIL